MKKKSQTLKWLESKPDVIVSQDILISEEQEVVIEEIAQKKGLSSQIYLSDVIQDHINQIKQD